MTAALFITMGLIAIVATLPGVFYPASHQAFLKKIISDEKKARLMAPFMFIFGLWCLAASGLDPVKADTYLASLFGVLYIPLGLLLLFRPGLYLTIMEAFMDESLFPWRGICVIKNLAGIGMIAWGIWLL
ncbi:MAG: hypothetical protein P1V97_09290 [Planctomycetota bacterium]|nr:hypothetical protein [Planctomycetota bacterium]